MKKMLSSALKKLILITLLFAQISMFANAPSGSELSSAPQSLAEIKSKQLGKLAGFSIREKSKDLEAKEKKILVKIQRWFSHILNSEKSIPKLCAAAFLVGVLTSLTPCIYPMIPVTAGILSSEAGYGLLHQATKSVLYVFGIATVHSGLGYFAATTGMIFGQWLAHPYVALLLVLFFLFLALAMFGFYDISFKLNAAEVPKGRSLVATYFFGLVVGLASSPCLSPILAILLGFVGTLAQPLYGLALLFSFSMGINMILLLVGLFAGVVSSLPRPGIWMVEIKKLLGFLMLFGCVYFASPFLVRYQMLALCSAVFFSAFVYYAYSAKNERIMYLIQSSGNSEGLKHSVLGSFSIRVLIKTLLSLAALAATVYLGYIAYLVYCKITTIKLIAKFFLK